MSAPGDTSRDPTAAAFFDVDNTMMVGASIYHFAKGLAARGFFSWRDLVRFTAKQVALRVGGENKDHMHSSRDSALVDKGGSLVLTYWPSEFAQLRAQYRHTDYAEQKNDNELRLQLQFALGAYGAHPF